MFSYHSPRTRSIIIPICAIILVGIFNSGCNRAVLLVRNSVVSPDGQTSVGAYVHRKPMFPFLEDIEGQSVEFFVNDRSIGHGVSDKKGTVEMPAQLAPGDQFVSAAAKVDGEQLRSTARTFHWDPNKVIIVIDIDNTISYTELSKIFGSRKPTLHPIADSRDALVRLAEQFQIFYVTARPRRLLQESRDWLDKHGFPSGPVFTSPGVTEIGQKIEHKVANIMKLKRSWPGVLIGIGNKASDAEAYGQCGMLSIIVRPQQEKDHRNHALFFPSWYAIAKFFDANMDTLANMEKVRELVASKGQLVMPLIGFEEGTRNEAEEEAAEEKN